MVSSASAPPVASVANPPVKPPAAGSFDDDRLKNTKIAAAEHQAKTRGSTPSVRRNRGVPHFAETQDYVRRITNIYYSGTGISQIGPSRDPVHVQRDARGVLYISNTE